VSSGRAIDHVVIAGRDLDGLAARYQALGFTLTPRAYHEDRMGTSNRLAQFRGRNFIELIEVDRPETVEEPGRGGFAFGAFLKRYLARREGLAMIVFRTDDARADIAAWKAGGIDTYDPFDFQRQARLPDGSEATVGFSLGFATSREMPEAAFFVCQNRAEEHFWRPAYQEHANGAEEIAAVRLVARDPARHGDFMARLFGGAVTERPGGVSVACGPHSIDVLMPEALPGWQGDPGDGALGAGLAVRAPARAGTITPAAEAGSVSIEWVS
jgi:Glyoxalase-like domain